MRIILTSDINKLGSAGEIVEVKNGYGRNYLIPQKLAILATKGAEKQISGIKRAREASLVRDVEHANEIKQKIENIGEIVIPTKTTQQGKLFGSITANDIAKAIKDASGQSIDKRKISIPDDHIKSLGKTTVTINIHNQVKVPVVVNITT